MTVNTATARTSIDDAEVERFSRMSGLWWDVDGPFRPLHQLNPVRLEFIRDHLCRQFGRDPSRPHPLSGLRVADIGCGGGLLSEPMCRLGAEVVGIDASDKNINVAKLHAKENNLNIKYFCASPETFKTNTKFDVILNMEIIEHVEDVDLFLKACSKHLKKNGIMFIATLNQTLKSYLFAIVGAEYILNWLPIGTHDWEKFIKPAKLVDIAKNYKLNLREKQIIFRGNEADCNDYISNLITKKK